MNNFKATCILLANWGQVGTNFDSLPSPFSIFGTPLPKFQIPPDCSSQLCRNPGPKFWVYGTPVSEFEINFHSPYLDFQMEKPVFRSDWTLHDFIFQVFDVQFHPNMTNTVVSCGVKHIKFWSLSGNTLSAKKGVFGKVSPSCIRFWLYSSVLTFHPCFSL